jgi:hypothetical protein
MSAGQPPIVIDENPILRGMVYRTAPPLVPSLAEILAAGFVRQGVMVIALAKADKSPWAPERFEKATRMEDDWNRVWLDEHLPLDASRVTYVEQGMGFSRLLAFRLHELFPTTPFRIVFSFGDVETSKDPEWLTSCTVTFHTHRPSEEWALNASYFEQQAVCIFSVLY